MNLDPLYRKALAREPLTCDEALNLYTEAPLGELSAVAWTLRKEFHPDNIVTWQIRPQRQHHEYLHFGVQVLQLSLQTPSDRTGLHYNPRPIHSKNRRNAGFGW